MQSALVERTVFKWLFGNIREIHSFSQLTYYWAFVYVIVVNWQLKLRVNEDLRGCRD